jgi:hypothetical protein
VKTSPHQDAADVVAELRARVGMLGPQPEQMLRFMNGMAPLLEKSANLIEQQAKALSEAMKHLTILADDMGDVVEAQYVGRKDYPSEARRYERDIAPVRAARSFLNSASNKEESTPRGET